MTTEEFLREAALIMHPRRPIEVTYEDCLEVMRERYVLEDRLDDVEQLEQDLRDAQNNVAELKVEIEDLKAKAKA